MPHDDTPPPIAIIGTACRFPGLASSPSKLWKLLKEPRDLLKEIPRDRFHWEGVYRADGLHGSIKTKEGYFLEENIRVFDPQFFNISPAEAENIDPQHRLLLENVYEAIESAGLCLEDLQGTDVGVFAGLMANEYYENANHDVDASSGQILTTGTARSMIANRVSYCFDFRGPSMTVDTACSSSMMAVHLAVASLRRAESQIAFVCGAHLNLAPHAFKALSKMNMISPDGRSKMFDEAADGYGRGEGTAVLCLKRLDAALKDGDTIECIIRETGTNQDGRTKGITMPNAEAQTDLIRRTYKSAGLDPTQPGSRPSFFEAHGTGTLVGDPLEAQAVEAAFFPPGREYDDDEFIYIGSIKTVLGHTEGAAGIAGMLRAALAVRHGVVPPNLLFSRMSPRVSPYTTHLHLPVAPNPWPTLPQGCPRRASINSFGFGGTNVHVILESYVQPPMRQIAGMSSLTSVEAPLFTPFVFSGVSEQALTANLENYITYLQNQKDHVRLHDLSWTLQYKRSQFSFRHAVAVCGTDGLLKNLQSTIQNFNAKRPGVYTRASALSGSKHPRIMGIFTGQGAQWATMGKELIDRSPFARTVIAKLDAALASLPESDRPQWKLKEELTVEPRRSRINEATLAQPLTTAVQILLVDLTKIAGLRLQTVVGHSSGEIAAAYAAGLISAEDAVRIAYYRGMHSNHARGVRGQQGGMLAASLAPEEANNFCQLPQFVGRLVVAAYNSPSLVTLAGDVDAVAEAATKLESENVFARKLQVDKAYHSQHMDFCAGPYLQSLEQLDIACSQPVSASPIWFSSAFPGRRMSHSTRLKPSYWTDNLMRPVHFFAAVRTAVSDIGVPDLIIEFGPHPALEKPVHQIIDDLTQNGIAYTGLLRRGTSALASVSDALGFVWCRFGRDAVDFANLEKVLSNETNPQPMQLKTLPTYPWRHEKEYWWENRFLRKRFQSTTPPIDLLGEEWEIGASHEAKWRCFLNPGEVPWLLKHKLKGVAVLPGAAYVAMASTAAKRIFREHSIQMVEIENLRFELPIVFPDVDTKIETIFSAIHITRNATHGEADFYVDFCSHPRNDELMTAARGKLIVRFGFDADRLHPEPIPKPSDLTAVDQEDFYKTLSDSGYGYSGPFRSIQTLRRRMDFATGEISATGSDLTLHPATLDCLFQGSFAADSYPGDSVMPNFRVPSHLRSIKIFPTRCEEVLPAYAQGPPTTRQRSAYSEVRTEVQRTSDLSTAAPSRHLNPTPGPILLFDIVRTTSSEYAGVLQSTSGEGILCQMDGLVTAPFRMSTSEDDLTMFQETVWTPCLPYHIIKNFSQQISESDKQLSLACERVSLYYLRQLNEDVTITEERRAQPALRRLLEYARLTLLEVHLGLLPHLDKDWLDDDKEVIARIIQQYPDSIDLECIELMGKAYSSIISGHTSAVNVLFEGGHLNKLYRDGLGFPEMNRLLASFLETLTGCSPRVKILEVGGGTGSTSETILATASVSNYVFTDVSSAFLGPAKEKLKQYMDRLSFRTFDMEKNPEEQGFEPESFDIIVASNVLHASADVKSVLRRLRSLLRPGGHLVCVELGTESVLRTTVVMGALEGWWKGHGQDRYWSPALTKRQWHDYLKETGYAGLDAITPPIDDLIGSYRVFCSQAVDERIVSFRKPLMFRMPKRQDSLLIVGAEPLDHFGLILELKSLLSASFRKITTIDSLDYIKSTTTIPYAVLSLVELHQPIFCDMNSKRWSALQRLLLEATDVLWVTCGATSSTIINDSYANMTTGLGRAVRNELPHLRLTFLDIEHHTLLTAKCLAQRMLRWYMMGQWAAEGWQDDVLFPQQTELAIKDGLLLAPTVRNSKQRNHRYNSHHRRIFENVTPHSRPVELAFEESNSRFILRGVPQALGQATQDSVVLVKMLCTTLYAFKVKNAGYLFLGLGVRRDGTKVITLSEASRSFLQIPESALHPCNAMDTSNERYLHAVTAQFVAARAIGAARSTGSIVVICGDSVWMSALQAQAESCRKQVIFVTSQPTLEQQWAIFLHHNSLDLIIRQKIPAGISVVVNLSTHQDDEVLFQRVCSVLRVGNTKIRDRNAFFATKSTGYDFLRALTESNLTADICQKATRAVSLSCYETSTTWTISPKDAPRYDVHRASTIVDWTATETIPVTILPATTDVAFSPEKTYLVVGTSDIARSICEWMMGGGARYIAIASRDPNHLRDWATDMTTKGAVIHVGTMDVSDEGSVKNFITSARAGHNLHRVKMPPIGGVMHLGLVLRDAAFSNMSFEDLQAVTDVKANGSLNLHKQLKDEHLDFFVLASSISYITGNPGQSNYTAGNAFMVGLAKYRRSIGLPASVVHLGRVTGIGYILRNANEKALKLNSEELRKMGAYPISERDLHQIFAEAILASSADSGVSPEIITGLRNMKPDMVNHSFWAKNPMSAHLLTEASNAAQQKPESTLTVRQRLNQEVSAQASSPSSNNIQNIVKTALVDKLGVLLQMDAIDEDRSLLDLGIDSLVAAEIGSWARKELRVQIPNSLIFGGASVKDIVEVVVRHLDRGWVRLNNAGMEIGEKES